jgi:hypothetical protein
MFITHGTEYNMSRVLPSGIPDQEFRSKLILPWNDLILTGGISGIPENEAQQ